MLSDFKVLSLDRCLLVWSLIKNCLVKMPGKSSGCYRSLLAKVKINCLLAWCLSQIHQLPQNQGCSSNELTILVQGGTSELQKAPEQDVSREFLYVSDFQFTLEETLDSFQKSVCEDMRNLHIEILRQFHMQAMEMSTVTSKILANQPEVRKKLISLERKPAASAIFLALVLHHSGTSCGFNVHYQTCHR
ncbi:uncharacterized protein LOC112173474 isoform X3 [Rosa chinensis]|uniref:uncharacterized protein LOC112173474 isoform X3 n=1 Tax=Rosa chinensis TaxID=74649 RepID=UPI001AD8E421|nr:uncharacterized protein LOC112173474 isoform X3 [Rosa chinensis]